MPIYKIGLDDGRSLQIEADSQEAALAGVQHFQDSEAKAAPSGALAGVTHGTEEAVNSLKETAKDYLGVGDGPKPSDPNYVPANVTNGSYNPLKWNYDQLPQKAAELAPGLAQNVVGATAGAKIGKTFGGSKGAAVGGFLGAVVPQWFSTAGNAAKEDAVRRTGDQNATPDASDLTRAGLTSGVSAAAQALGPMRFVPGANKVAAVGSQGALDSIKKYLATTAIGGASGAAGNTIDQVGNTIGTDKGVQFDPKQAIDAGLGNAALAGVVGAPRAAADVVSATRLRNFDGSNAAATAGYVKRLTDNAGPTGLGNGKNDYTAQENTKRDIRNELSNVDNSSFNQDTQNALKLAASGQPINDDHVGLIESADPAAGHLARQLNVAQQAEDFGSYDRAGRQWTGGLSGVADKYAVSALKRHAVLGAASTLGGVSMMGSYGLPALASATGAYGAVRAADAMAGLRSPAKAFAQRFADAQAATRLPTAQPPAPPAPPSAPAAGPWGPKPLPQQSVPQTVPPSSPPPAGPWGPRPLPQQSVPPVAPPAPPPPAAPQFNPLALSTLKQTLKQGLPPTPQAPAPAPTPPPINPLALPTSITTPTKNIMSGIVGAQAMKQKAQATDQVNSLSSPLMDDAPLNVASNPLIGKVAAARVSAANALKKYTAVPEAPEEGADGSAVPPVVAAAALKITKKPGGAVKVTPAAPAADPWDSVGAYTPPAENPFAGKSVNDITKMTMADDRYKGLPPLAKLAVQNSINGTRTARDASIAGLKQQLPNEQVTLDQLREALHAPGNSNVDASMRAVKHHAGLMSPDAGKVVRDHFARADVRDAIWPTKARSPKKKNVKTEATAQDVAAE